MSAENKELQSPISFAEWLERKAAATDAWAPLVADFATDMVGEDFDAIAAGRRDAAIARALAAHLEQIEQWAAVNPECEVRVSSEDICGVEAWFWYPADGGGTMALCERHAEKHRYAQRVPRVWDICHQLAAGFTDPNAAIQDPHATPGRPEKQ